MYNSIAQKHKPSVLMDYTGLQWLNYHQIIIYQEFPIKMVSFFGVHDKIITLKEW